MTGAAGGLGTPIVKRFLANDDTLVATDTSDEALQKLVQASGKAAKLFSTSADIADEASCTKLASFTRDKAGRVDVLVNNAGFFPTNAFDDLTLADWNKVIGINLTGVFLMVKAMLPLMTGLGWGRIANLATDTLFPRNAPRKSSARFY